MHHTCHSLSLLPLTHSLGSSLHRSSAVQRCEIHKGNLPPSRPGLHQPHIMPFLSCTLAPLNSLVPQPSKPSPSPAPPPDTLCPLQCLPPLLPLVLPTRTSRPGQVSGPPKGQKKPGWRVGESERPQVGGERDGARLAVS